MTNQSTDSREPEREPERLRSHSIPSKSEPPENSTSSLKSTIATTLTLPTRLDSELSSPTSPTRLQTQQHSPTTPIDLYKTSLNRDRDHHLHDSSLPISATRTSPYDEPSFVPKEERASSPDDDGMSNDVGEQNKCLI